MPRHTGKTFLYVKTSVGQGNVSKQQIIKETIVQSDMFVSCTFPDLSGLLKRKYNVFPGYTSQSVLHSVAVLVAGNHLRTCFQS